MKNTFVLLAIMGAFAVIMGAFGAHGLRSILPDTSLEVWKTASQYHFIHTLAAFIVLMLPGEARWKRLAFLFFVAGIFCFSGSLYLLSTASVHQLSVRFLGPITPLGGLLLIMGWLAMAWSVRSST